MNLEMFILQLDHVYSVVIMLIVNNGCCWCDRFHILSGFDKGKEVVEEICSIITLGGK
jgi:hypothetical protein